MALPHITLTGNLTQDVEVFTTKNGHIGAKISVACNDRKFVNNAWVDGDTIFLNGVVWGTYAENAVATLSKGDTVTLTGKLSQRSYMAKDNTEKSVIEINIESLSADLRRTSYLKSGIVSKKVTTPEVDAWSQPLSDNSFGVNF